MSLTNPRPRPVKCPRCQSMDGVPIRYGYPDPDLADAARRGEVVLGGCDIGGNDPIWFCRTCRARWDAEGKVWEDEDPGEGRPHSRD